MHGNSNANGSANKKPQSSKIEIEFRDFSTCPQIIFFPNLRPDIKSKYL